MPPACIGANVSQTTIIITIEKADNMLGENLLYTSMLIEAFRIVHKKRPASPTLDMQVFRLLYIGCHPASHYCVAITRNSLAAATVTPADGHVQVLPDPLQV